MHRQSLFSPNESKQRSPTGDGENTLAEPLLRGTVSLDRDSKLRNYINNFAYSRFTSGPKEYKENMIVRLRLLYLRATANNLKRCIIEEAIECKITEDASLMLMLSSSFLLLPGLAGIQIASCLSLVECLVSPRFTRRLMQASLAEVIALCPSQHLTRSVIKLNLPAEEEIRSSTAAEIKPQAEARTPSLMDTEQVKAFFTHSIDALKLQDIVSLQTSLADFLSSLERINEGITEHIDHHPGKLLRAMVDELDAERIGHGSFGGAIFAPHPRGQNGRRAPNPRQLILEYLIERDNGEEIAREASVSATPPSPNRRCVVQ